MPLPDGYLPREGDVLTIHAEVTSDFRPDSRFVHCDLQDGHTEMFKLSSITALRRRAWREGEGVMHKRIEKWWGKIVTMHGDHAIVALDAKADQRGATGGLRVFHCNELMAWPGAESRTAAEEIQEAPPAPPPGAPPSAPAPSDAEEPRG